MGGMPERSTHDIMLPTCVQVEAARNGRVPWCGILWDKAKCFDRFVPAVTSRLLLELGAHAGYVGAVARRDDPALTFLKIG
eukprot:13730537-Alexandrium_andersonii.AAC.1